MDSTMETKALFYLESILADGNPITKVCFLLFCG